GNEQRRNRSAGLRHSGGIRRRRLSAPRRKYGGVSAAGDREVAGQRAEAKSGVPTKPASWGGKDGVERRGAHLKMRATPQLRWGPVQGPGPQTHASAL